MILCHNSNFINRMAEDLHAGSEKLFMVVIARSEDNRGAEGYIRGEYPRGEMPHADSFKLIRWL